MRKFLFHQMSDSELDFDSKNLIASRTGTGKTMLPVSLLNAGILEGKTLIVTTNEVEVQLHSQISEEDKNVSYDAITYDELNEKLEVNKDYLNEYSNVFYDEVLVVLHTLQDEEMLVIETMLNESSQKVFMLSQSYTAFNSLIKDLVDEDLNIKVFDYT